MVDSHGVFFWARSTFLPSSSSSSSSSRIQFHSRIPFQNPYWTEIDCFSWWYQPHIQIPQVESDPINPTQFYFLVYCSKFPIGPRLIVLVGGSRTIPGGSVPISGCCRCTLLLLWNSGDVSFRDQIIGTFRRVDFLLACFPACYYPRRLFDFFCCGLPFQIVGTDTNCFSWWFDSGTRNPLLLVSILSQVVWFCSEVRAGSS